MKHLQTYKIFETKSLAHIEAEFTNDQYKELSDTLTTEIFDEFNIPYIDEWNTENIPENRHYWTFETIKKIKISRIVIENLTKSLKNKIFKELEEIKPIIKGRTGLEYKFESYGLIEVDDQAIYQPRPYCYINIDLI